jgi:hypothetical protein
MKEDNKNLERLHKKKLDGDNKKLILVIAEGVCAQCCML